MLNKKLVYYFFVAALFTVTGLQPIEAKPLKSKKNTIVVENNSVLRFDLVRLNPARFAAGYYWRLPQLPINKAREEYVTRYLSRYNDYLASIARRRERFFPIMDSVFSRYNLPRELKYLAVVESELNTHALSAVGARGTWQLMPETARTLKLTVNDQYDERTHLYKSTVAAAKYLRDLYRMFDDWLLTIAAYNSGPGPVLKAIRLSGSRNFWKLQSYLPAETRGHVKRFIAVHYYFEGKGGLTILTKSERKTYQQELGEWVSRHNILLQGLATSNGGPTGAPTPEKETETELSVRQNAEIYRETMPVEIVKHPFEAPVEE